MTRSNRSLALYRRLLRVYVWRYRRMLILAGGCMIVVAGANATQAYLMQPVLDDIFVHKNEHLLMLLPLVLVVLSLLNALGDYGQSLALKYVGQRVVSDMQGDLFAHLMQADLSLFHDQASGRLISRLTNDIMLMRYSVSQVITGAIKESLTLVFLVGVMLWQSLVMSAVAMFILVFAILPVARLGRRMRKVADATQLQLADFTAQLDDTFQGVRMVKAYGREAFEAARVRDHIHGMFTLYYKASRIQSLAAPIMNLLGGIAIAAIIWYGGFKVVHGNTTPGAFFSFITALLMVYRPVKVIAGLNTQLQEGMAAAARFFEVVDQPASITDAPDAVPLPNGPLPIRFEQVHFHYARGRGGVEALDFTLSPGTRLALVGASGAGKTTVINLLLRFYDPQAGRITLAGIDIRQLQLAALRGAMALVSQEVVLFNDTVRANIAYGRLEATEAQIVSAARRAHAHEFIMRLPQGYDTPIGPHGVTLSGGQRQRLSIARAILKDAPILLLDEATSALDGASEQAVQEALNDLMTGRTTLIIAHRLSTIRHADEILVFDHGRIVGRGTHDSLLQHHAHYRHLYALAAGGHV